MRTALIDADILAYRATAAVEKEINWGDDVFTLHSDLSDAKKVFTDHLSTILAAVEAEHCILAFSDSLNWRKDILPTYKSNRTDRKPLALKALKQWVTECGEWEVFQRPTLEGDDVLGILATKGKKHPDDGPYIVCSLDKDFRTIPGSHYNFGTKEFFEVSQYQADLYHMGQTLTGDATDGYAGCPGIGPKTAEKILNKAEEACDLETGEGHDLSYLRKHWWAAVVATYEKAGLSGEVALIQARVARICRASDYNFNDKTVKLWNPPQ